MEHTATELQREDLQEKKEICSDSCPICKGTGWELFIDENGRDVMRECSNGCRSKILHERTLRFADIPEAFRDVRLDNFRKEVYREPESREKIVDVAKAVRYWLRGFSEFWKAGVGLYFYSATKGSGKTRLMVSIGNELMEKYGVRVKFATSLQILDEIRRTWDGAGKEQTESRLLNSLITTEILMIDDFGVEQEKGWVNEKFYSIINGRYIGRKVTLFTSNQRLDDLHYDSRIVSRIQERVFQIPFPEESVRKNIAEQLRKQLFNGITEERR